MEVEGIMIPCDTVNTWILEKEKAPTTVEMPVGWTMIADAEKDEPLIEIAKWVCKQKSLTFVSVVAGFKQSVPMVGTFYAILFVAKNHKGNKAVYESVVLDATGGSRKLLSFHLLVPLPF